MDEYVITVKKIIACRLGSARPKTGNPLFLTEKKGAQSYGKRSESDKGDYPAAL